METRITNRNKILKDNAHHLIERYAEGKYEDTINALPGFLESLGICIICDSEKYEDCEENKNRVNDIISGAKQWKWNNSQRLYNLEPNSHGRLESGSTLDAAKTSVLNTININRPTDYSYFYKSIGGLFDALKQNYDLAKQIGPGSHCTNFTNRYAYDQVARTDIANIALLKEIFAKENLFSLETLTALASIVIDDKDEWHYELDNKDVNNARRTIEDLTNHFDTSKKYIMIAPPFFKDKYGNRMDNGFLLNLFRIPWTMVIDFNDKSEDGLYKSLPNELRNIYYEIQKGREDYVPNGNSKCPWVFANGTGYNSCKEDFRKWLNERYYRFVKSVFDRMNQSVSDYVFFWFYDEGFEYAEELLRTFDRDFFDKKSNTFISICNGNDDFERVMSELKDKRGFETNPLKTDVVQFILDTFGYESLSKTNNTDSQHIYIMNSDGEQWDLTNDIKDLKDMGFELVTRESKDDDSRKWNFYQGAEISWTELNDHKDVEREGLDELTKAILSIIKEKSSNPNPREYIISYSAGSGSTTMSRRLGYDIFRKSEEHEFGEKRCVVIFLHEFNRQTTNSGLVNLSMRIDNQPILVICDFCDIPDGEYEDLKDYCHNRNVVFIRLKPKDVCKKYDFMMPLEISKKEEFGRFVRRYEDSFGKTSKIEEIRSSFETSGKIEVIEFPLRLEDNASDNLVDYVKIKIDELPSENLKLFCELIAFGYYFYGKPINSKLFRQLLLDITDREYSEQYLQSELRYLLIQVESSKEWRPRYNQFAKWIMQVCSNDNWDSQTYLTHLAEKFVEECSKNIDEDYNNGQKELGMLADIFAKRKDGNLVNDDDLKKFSPYIQKVGIEVGERILKQLIYFWPDYPFFSIHYARLLFERAAGERDTTPDDDDYIKAGELIENALKGNEYSDEVWHVRGMRYFRMIKSLRNQFNSLKAGEKETKGIDYLNRLKEYVNNAQDSFKTCERLNPRSSFGYATEAGMYYHALDFAKEIKQTNSFTFVLDEYPWNEYLERFEEAYGILASPEVSILSDDLKEHRLHLLEITGDSKEVLNKYYSEAINNDNSSERRIFYGSIYHRIFFEKKKNSYKDLSSREYENLVELYRKNAEICQDINSYRRWFDILRYGKEPVNFEDAIDILKDWRALCIEKCEKLQNTKNEYELGRIQRSLLLANFYLCVCMTCQIILKRKNSEVLRGKVKEIEKEVAKSSENIPELKDRQFYHRCFLTEKNDLDENDLHYIEDFSSVEDERNHGLKIEGEYYSENNKGHIQLDCGLSVSYYDLSRKADYYANGKRFEGVIVFKYGGTGMHEAKLVERDSSAILPVTEETVESADVKQEEQSQIETQPVSQTVSSESNDGLKGIKLKGVTHALFHGELKRRDGKFYILCEENNREYIVTYDLNNDDLYDGQKVVFQLIMDVTNPRRPNFMKAVKIDVDDEN